MSQQLIYILLGAAFVIFIIVTIRDWALQRSKFKDGTTREAGAPSKDVSLPLRLQAYERLVVFMERIKPENLTTRIGEPGLLARDLRMLMIHSVQSEFEHNLSQQIYVSTEAWEAVSSAKEQTVSLINSVSEQVPPETDGRTLAKHFLEFSLHEKEFPARTALSVLNTEAKKLMQ